MSNAAQPSNGARQSHIEALLAELAMRTPELAPALARIEMNVVTDGEFASRVGRPGIAAIRRNGVGYITDKFADEDAEDVKMVLAHEALHLVVERVARIEDMAGGAWDGDYPRANIATDRWINQILVDVGICAKEQVEKFHGVLPQLGHEQNDVMDIWRAERAQKKSQGAGQAMAGCNPGDLPGEGEGDQDAQDGGQDPQDVRAHQEAHSILAGMASQSPALRKLIAPPPPKARWQDVMREAASCARGLGGGVRPTTTRAKLGRRSQEEIPRPGIRTRKPQLVVVVDISGSMSGLLDEVLAESDAISSLAHVHLVLHDAKVLFSGQYKKGRDKIAPAGGTTFAPAIYEAARVAEKWDGESVVVHLTDGCPCDEWPEVPTAFRVGYVAIFGGYEVKGPGRWRTRHVDKMGK